MADATLEIDLRTSEQSRNKLVKDTKDTGEEAGSAFGSGFAKAAGALIVAAIGKATFNAAVNAASIQEKAVNRLNVSLKLSGDLSQKTSQDMQNFASNLQQVSRFGDETTLELLALAKGMGATSEQAKGIVTAAADASEALGIDFQTAVRGIGQTLSGQSGSLARYVGSLRTLTADQLKAGGAIDLISKQFSGAALGAINTYAGATTQNSNAWGDMLEVIGDYIIKSPLVIKLIKGTTDAIVNITNKIANFRTNGGLQELVSALAIVGRGINEFLIAPFELVLNAANFVFAKITEGVGAAVAVIGKFGGAIAEGLSFLGVENKFTEGLKTFRETSQETFTGLVEDSNAAFGEMFNFNIADKVDGFIGEFERLAVSTSEIIEESSAVNAEKMKTSFELMWGTAKGAFDGILVSSSVLASGLSSAINQMVTSLASGQGGFKAFAGIILNIIGDMAIRIGSTIVAIGFAILGLEAAVKGLSGGVAIAAGSALIAVGALTKVFAGQLGAAAVGDTPAATGGGVATADSPISETVTDQPELENNEPKTNVSLVVNGDIFDSDETQSRLFQLLNEGFETKGQVLSTGIVA